MISTVYLTPTGDGVDGLMLGVLCGSLDGIADTVLDTLAHFQNAVHAPVLGQPVEPGQLRSGDFNFRQTASALMNAPQTNPSGGLHAVIPCDLGDDPRREVAQLPIVGTLLAVSGFQQTVVNDFVLLCIVWFFGHRLTSLAIKVYCSRFLLTTDRPHLCQKKVGAVSILRVCDSENANLTDSAFPT